MKTLAAALTTVLAVAVTAAFASAPETEAVDVYVGIPPQEYLVSRVAGDLARVHTLVPVGQSPHSFELTPRQMAGLATSRAYFAVGLPFEEHVVEKLTGTNPSLLIVDTGAGIPRRSMDTPEAHWETSAHIRHEGRPDPHIWLSPRLACAIAANIRNGLVEIDPEHAADYEINLKALVEDLERLDQDVAKMLEPHAGRNFYVFHPAFGYFADAYGLTQIPIEAAGKEPGIRDLVSFIERARADRVTTLFVQLQFPKRTAETVAAGIGAEVVALDPLDRDYLNCLRRIAESVRAALSPPEADR